MGQQWFVQRTGMQTFKLSSIIIIIIVLSFCSGSSVCLCVHFCHVDFFPQSPLSFLPDEATKVIWHSEETGACYC